MRATVPSTRVHYFFRVYSPRVSRANLPYRLIFPFLCRRRGRDEKGEGRRGKAGGNFSRVAPRLSVESPSRKERLRWNWSVVFDVCGRFFFSSSFFSCFFVVVSINRFVFVRCVETTCCSGLIREYLFYFVVNVRVIRKDMGICSL